MSVTQPQSKVALRFKRARRGQPRGRPQVPPIAGAGS